MSVDVLVIDDEEDIRDLISEILRDEGYMVRAGATSAYVFQALADKIPSLIILDVWLQNSELDGLGILEIVKKRYPLIPVIVISGHGTIETAVNAIKIGAYDYLEKPFTHDKLIIMLKRAYEATKLQKENLDLKSKITDRAELIGNSVAINRLRADINKVAPTSGRVLISGDVGTGKELIAKLIHKKSKRSEEPFVTFSPMYLSDDKIEQELFTGVNNGDYYKVRYQSLLELADNGTLYIDEVGDLSYSAQTKLLKFLQDGIIEKHDGTKSVKLDVRVIASTSRNLLEAMNKNMFRQDLYYRLNVIPIPVPRLLDRLDDIYPLIKYFVKHLTKFSGIEDLKFADDVITIFQSYHWPGNVSELRNVIERIFIMNAKSFVSNPIVTANMVPKEVINCGTIAGDTNNIALSFETLKDARSAFERQFLRFQMQKSGWNVSKTASIIGMERSALHRKLKALGLNTGAEHINCEEMIC